jgi:hypothetical protein
MAGKGSRPFLATEICIGILGATQGDLNYLLTPMKAMFAHGVQTLVVLGDFGFVWARKSRTQELDIITDELAANGQHLFYVDGNHEDFTELSTYPVSDDGVRWVRPNIGHLPRGYRTVLASGETLAALGGANSIDKDLHVGGGGWWAEESITDRDLDTLGTEPVDILIGHDAPLAVTFLDAALAGTGQTRSEEMRAYARAGRRLFHRGFLQVRPKLYLGGHYYVTGDETVHYNDEGGGFDTRVVLLSAIRSPHTSQAVLDVRTREVKLVSPEAAVIELTGRESGRWEVQTQSSHYVFDFDAGTVTRHPGRGASPTINDRTRPLRTIERCRVGKRGAWYMEPNGGYTDPTDYYWAVCTEIRSIERLPDEA